MTKHSTAKQILAAFDKREDDKRASGELRTVRIQSALYVIVSNRLGSALQEVSTGNVIKRGDVASLTAYASRMSLQLMKGGK